MLDDNRARPLPCVGDYAAQRRPCRPSLLSFLPFLLLVVFGAVIGCSKSEGCADGGDTADAGGADSKFVSSSSTT